MLVPEAPCKLTTNQFLTHKLVFFSKDQSQFSRGDNGNKNKIHLQDLKLISQETPD